RRRHTSWPRDWSSDVCSSDLGDLAGRLAKILRRDAGHGSRCELAKAQEYGESLSPRPPRYATRRLYRHQGHPGPGHGDVGVDGRSEERRGGKVGGSGWWAWTG